MKEYNVTTCNQWDGLEKTCDIDRCYDILSQNDRACYHKPIQINGERYQVVGATKKIAEENPNGEPVIINGKQMNQLEAVLFMFDIQLPKK